MHAQRLLVAILILGTSLALSAQPAGQAPQNPFQTSAGEAPPARTPSQPPQLPENAPRVDIFALIDRLAAEMDKEFILDPQIARITGLSTARADADYDTLLALLRQNQYAAIETGDQIRIIPEALARAEASPILNEDDSRVSDHAVVTRVIDVSDIELMPGVPSEQVGSVAPQLIPVLRPMMSTSIGNVTSIPGTTKIMLVDRYDNIRRITALIDALR